MGYSSPVKIEITGMGIITSIGQTIADFQSALLAGKTQFGYLTRPGRKGSN